MSTNLDCVSRGLQRAFAKRQAEKSRQVVRKVLKDVTELNADVSTIKPSASSVKQSDEQYRMSIIRKMINHIHKREIA